MRVSRGQDPGGDGRTEEVQSSHQTLVGLLTQQEDVRLFRRNLRVIESVRVQACVCRCACFCPGNARV